MRQARAFWFSHWTTGEHSVIPHSAPSGQRTVHSSLPLHSTWQSPEQVTSQRPVPLHWAKLSSPISAVQTDVPGHSVVQLTPHENSQLALPSHLKVTSLPPSMTQIVPPMHSQVRVSLLQAHCPSQDTIAGSSLHPGPSKTQNQRRCDGEDSKSNAHSVSPSWRSASHSCTQRRRRATNAQRTTALLVFAVWVGSARKHIVIWEVAVVPLVPSPASSGSASTR